SRRICPSFVREATSACSTWCAALATCAACSRRASRPPRSGGRGTRITPASPICAGDICCIHKNEEQNYVWHTAGDVARRATGGYSRLALLGFGLRIRERAGTG